MVPVVSLRFWWGGMRFKSHDKLILTRCQRLVTAATLLVTTETILSEYNEDLILIFTAVLNQNFKN